jgi:GntR family transcriptional regulator
MILRVDAQSPMPAYEQLRSQLETLITSGTLAAGTQLPTIRQLALDLGLAKATVNKAYELLLRDDYIVSNGRRGTLVADRPSRTRNNEARAQLQRAAHDFVGIALLLGVDLDQARAALEAAYKKEQRG